MATVIKAGNVASGAQVTSDSTGILQFNTGSGAGTTAMTIGTDQSVTFAATPTYSGGTANGVAYLNASKALTTGTALVFDGTNLSTTGSATVNGTVSIGTTPATGGDIRLPNGGIIATRNAANSGNRILLRSDSSNNVLLQEDSVVINSSGNLGLGVTPSAWQSAIKAFQFTNIAAIFSDTTYTSVGHNFFINSAGTGIYSTTAAASWYRQTSGQHQWFNAPSGTAGNAITFTQAMTLDASGNLGIGTSSPAANSLSLSSKDVISTYSQTDSNSGAGKFIFNKPNFTSGSQFVESFVAQNNATTHLIGGVGTDSGGNIYTAVGNASNTPLTFRTNGTERARITSGGFVGIGTPSPNYKLTVQDDSATAGTIDVLDLFNGASSVATVGMVFRTGANNVTAAIRNVTTGTNAAALTFLTNNNAGLTERARFTAAGGFTCAGIYNTTVGATNRDVFVDNGGVVGYVASIREAKTNIQDLTDTSWLHQLNPVTFNYRKKDEEGNYTDETDGDIQYGMIAEDVEQVRPDLCFYDEVDGEQELRGIQYSKLVPVMLKEIQKLRAEIEALKGAA